MYRVLIVDDEAKIREVLAEYAEFEGYYADQACDGMDAVTKCKQNDYDIIIMDIMMPKLDGYSAVKEIKKFKDIPVIMLSARSEEYDKLFGFEIGIDDYVVKPFSPKEVMARINAVLKRKEQNKNAGQTPNNRTIQKFEGLEIDMTGRNVYVDGEKAVLTPKEYELLFYMVRNAGIALSREKLLSDVWGYDFYGDDRTVDTHIKMLRSNLKEYRKFIVTLRGMGYKFEV
ncbi:MAG: response regulator transcription factor [Clostridia bacterium]|nr:response regulator transcription factor [Clostridia bacterium]MDY2714379.1 response regulator transcription factor [Christensenellaceae bacterium]MDY3723924.1 response regulator transcription factor [Christensenellaceae bacterium]